MNRQQFQAIEILSANGIELEEGYEFVENEFYTVLIKTNDKSDNQHYFLCNENGEMFWDGWDKEPCIPIDYNPN